MGMTEGEVLAWAETLAYILLIPRMIEGEVRVQVEALVHVLLVR